MSRAGERSQSLSTSRPVSLLRPPRPARHRDPSAQAPERGTEGPAPRTSLTRQQRQRPTNVTPLAPSRTRGIKKARTLHRRQRKGERGLRSHADVTLARPSARGAPRRPWAPADPAAQKHARDGRVSARRALPPAASLRVSGPHESAAMRT